MPEEKQTNNIEEIDIEEFDEEVQDLFPDRYSISSYGADYVVDSLVKRIKAQDIYIPSFQREFIWSPKQSSSFIESLLLGLPVPGIFLSKDEDTKKLVVIDGQQRLRSLEYFYEGFFPNSKKQFSLVGVQSKYEGKTYKALEPEDRRQLDDSIIHATIIRQESPSEDNTSVYHIFQRLNTSGTPLTHQEIRSTIFLGEFNNLLEELNDNTNWRTIFGKKSLRKKDEEFILRFFALYFDYQNYSPPMRLFLNRFMQVHRNLNTLKKTELKQLFEKVVKFINESLGKSAFRQTKSLNAAIFDAVMVGLANKLAKTNVTEINKFKILYNELLESSKFQKNIETGTTAQSNSVKNRIQEALEKFEILS